MKVRPITSRPLSPSRPNSTPPQEPAEREAAQHGEPLSRWFRAASWVFGRRFISVDPVTGLAVKGRYWRGVTLVTDIQGLPSDSQEEGRP